MEPRPHERGNAAVIAALPSFFVTLQWSHVLTNVETTSTRRQQRREYRLQWSHVLTNVETRRRRRDQLELEVASMEPRPHERGNSPTGRSSTRRRTCFNGATSSRTWKLAGSSEKAREHIRFNGATSSRTWKRARLPPPRLRRACFNGATSSRTWKQRDKRDDDRGVE